MDTRQSPLTPATLRRQNHGPCRFGARSHQNHSAGFRPAFQDPDTGHSYLSRYADGSPAPFHLLDGLPRRLLAPGDDQRAFAINTQMIAGFLLGTHFYTRDQAAAAIELQNAA